MRHTSSLQRRVMLYCNNNSELPICGDQEHAYMHLYGTPPLFQLSWNVFVPVRKIIPSILEGKSWHLRTRHVHSSPCRRRRLPCSAAKSSQMILLVHDHWRITDSIIAFASCRRQKSIQHVPSTYCRVLLYLVHPAGSTIRGTSRHYNSTDLHDLGLGLRCKEAR
jgi:hypothetical protein